MTRFLRRSINDTKGIAALEYALIAGLIFAIIVGTVATLGTSLTTAFGNIGNSLTVHATGS